MTSTEIWHNKAKIAQAAKQFGTPFYCYDSTVLEKTFRSLRDALPKSVDIFYSIKANPNMALCNELRQLEACAELCSYYEIVAALKAGFDPDNIIFVGPAKADKEIKKCLELGIYAITCESIEEFKRISTLAGECGVEARVALRINPSHVSMSIGVEF